MKKGNTAILFFSRNVSLEARSKSWFTSRKAISNRQLAKVLIHQTEKFLSQKDNVFHFHEGLQKGGNFGERISNAFHDLFCKGYDSIIAIGNDSPEIVSLDWGSITRELKNEKLVLGANYRGGAYLIGICKDHFDRKAFEALPWQTKQLYTSLLDYSSYVGNALVHELPKLLDVNSMRDLEKIKFNRDLDNKIRNIIWQLLSSQVIFARTKLAFKQKRFSNYIALRAPPVS